MNAISHDPPDVPETSSVRCPRCRRVFDCGARSEVSACWCKSMPALPADALEPGSGCLCPECLATAIARARAAKESSAGSAAPAPD
ncbi:cysteine-rich CWC family protein [Paraburkholderia bengalensis]|uniref:Cysteine-rich CWC family protein n=1 Tax=Paraburkholderia bengalensis TaxID=2747562 RepID=A0ABU8INW6_9BURK